MFEIKWFFQMESCFYFNYLKSIIIFSEVNKVVCFRLSATASSQQE